MLLFAAKVKTATQTERVISSFHREADQNCARLGYSAARSGNSSLTSQENLLSPSSTVRIQNAAKELPLLAV